MFSSCLVFGVEESEVVRAAIRQVYLIKGLTTGQRELVLHIIRERSAFGESGEILRRIKINQIKSITGISSNTISGIISIVNYIFDAVPRTVLENPSASPPLPRFYRPPPMLSPIPDSPIKRATASTSLSPPTFLIRKSPKTDFTIVSGEKTNTNAEEITETERAVASLLNIMGITESSVEESVGVQSTMINTSTRRVLFPEDEIAENLLSISDTQRPVEESAGVQSAAINTATSDSETPGSNTVTGITLGTSRREEDVAINNDQQPNRGLTETTQRKITRSVKKIKTDIQISQGKNRECSGTRVTTPRVWSSVGARGNLSGKIGECSNNKKKRVYPGEKKEEKNMKAKINKNISGNHLNSFTCILQLCINYFPFEISKQKCLF